MPGSSDEPIEYVFRPGSRTGYMADDPSATPAEYTIDEITGGVFTLSGPAIRAYKGWQIVTNVPSNYEWRVIDYRSGQYSFVNQVPISAINQRAYQDLRTSGTASVSIPTESGPPVTVDIQRFGITKYGSQAYVLEDPRNPGSYLWQSILTGPEGEEARELAIAEGYRLADPGEAIYRGLLGYLTDTGRQAVIDAMGAGLRLPNGELANEFYEAAEYIAELLVDSLDVFAERLVNSAEYRQTA